MNLFPSSKSSKNSLGEAFSFVDHIINAGYLIDYIDERLLLICIDEKMSSTQDSLSRNTSIELEQSNSPQVRGRSSGDSSIGIEPIKPRVTESLVKDILDSNTKRHFSTVRDKLIHICGYDRFFIRLAKGWVGSHNDKFRLFSE